jgi:glucose-1-phosphate thymidylyltransferase
MKIIVPMAGRGSRLRPHSLTLPKPLIPVAGTPIVHQLVHEIAKVVKSRITDIGFVLGDSAFFGDQVVIDLKNLAISIGARPHIFRQLEPLGTGHAIMCAKELLEGPAVIAYADTLIRASLSLDPEADAVIWVKKVQHPEEFGVVELNEKGNIINLIEKPKKYVSDRAVIGIYYFKAIEQLKNKLEVVMQKNIALGSEYQINEGILALLYDGAVIKPGDVESWMDCGNPKATLQTNSEMLTLLAKEEAPLIDPSAIIENSTIIPPCFLGKNVIIKDSLIGPGVSIGEGTQIVKSSIKNSLIQKNCYLEEFISEKAMIGNHVRYKGNPTFVSLGDYSELQ